MRLASLPLRHRTGKSANEGVVVAPASNQRWNSNGLNIPCWNGEVVRIAFAIGTHDREIMARIDTTRGSISGD